jgi:hypothetical protein
LPASVYQRLRIPVFHKGFLDASQQVPETMVNLGPNRGRQRWFAPRCIGEMTMEGQQTVIGGRAGHDFATPSVLKVACSEATDGGGLQQEGLPDSACG